MPNLHVVYFVNGRDPRHELGYVMLAPYSECATPEGYRREEANTLAEVDQLQARLTDQEMSLARQELERDESRLEPLRAAVRDRLYARMTSGATDEFNKEFLRLYLQLQNDKRHRHRQRYLEREMYLTARENDAKNGRQPDEERRPDTLDLGPS